MNVLKYAGVIFHGLFILVLCFLLSGTAAGQKRIEKDLDQDGRTDQVLIYDDGGTILQVETDQDQDGSVERRQVYQGGKPSRIERDTDNDQKMDCIDYIENERRVRQDRFDPEGRRVQVTVFDSKEKVRLIKKNTTGNKGFDTVYSFQDGVLLSSTKDGDDNGKINVWTIYQNQVPTEQRYDENEDGIMDRVLIFDEKGNLSKLVKEPFAQEKFKTLCLFENGEITSRQRDTNKDGKIDDITLFEQGLLSEQKKDTNFDKKFDVLTRFVNNFPRTREKDTNFDGKTDSFTVFDDTGQLLETREDTGGNGKIDRIRYYRAGDLFRIERDTLGDGFFETISLIKNDKIVKTLVDKNRDGKPDTEISFHENQDKKQLISDTDFDGKPDVWQQYTNNLLSKFETDKNGDEKPDLRVIYQKGMKIFQAQDMDFDEYFEISQTYDDPLWSLVVSQDINADNCIDIRSFYTDSVLMRRESDEDADGVIDVVEIFNPVGALEKIEEKIKGKTIITWFYGAKETLVSAQQDKNQDGRVEIWYQYEQGRLKTVLEDTNLDGKPDLWETYDDTQAIVKREKDLDFDGTPDFVDRVEKVIHDS